MANMSWGPSSFGPTSNTGPSTGLEAVADIITSRVAALALIIGTMVVTILGVVKIRMLPGWGVLKFSFSKIKTVWEIFEKVTRKPENAAKYYKIDEVFDIIDEIFKSADFPGVRR